jgi:hypothetical protein
VDGDVDFDRVAVERILARAVELDDEPGAASGISARALVEAADELGLDTGAVLQAVGEERLGLLDPPARRGDRVLGRSLVAVGRTVEGPEGVVFDRADEWLRKACAFRRTRRLPGGAEYTRRSDLAAKVQRSVRSLTGEEDLRRVDRLRLEVRQVDDGLSLVALEVDLSAGRRNTVIAGTGLAGAGSAVSAAVAGLADERLWFWIGAPASAAAGLGVMVARSGVVDEVEVALCGLLECIAGGDGPAGMLSGVGRRLLASTPLRSRQLGAATGRLERPVASDR